MKVQRLGQAEVGQVIGRRDLDRALGAERHRILVKRLGWIRHRLLEEGLHTAEARRAGART